MPLRRSTTGQFDASLQFTYIVKEYDRIHAIQVPTADMCTAWLADLQKWGQAHPRLCIMERIAPSFNFFVHAQLPPHTQALDLVPRMRTVIREFGFVAKQCAVLQDTADPASNRYVWSDVCVSANRAYIIRERIIAEFASNDTPEHTSSYHWADVFGGKIYDPGLPGPSLPGSLKFALCTNCHNKAAVRRDCAQCMLRGFTISPGVTVPFALLEFDEADAMSNNSIPPKLEMCLIHTTKTISATWHVPPGTPFCVHAANAPIPTGGRKSRRKEPDLPPHIRDLIQSVIRSTHPVYHKLVVTNGSVNRVATDKYIIHPRGIGSQSCVKFRAEHTDSIIYFVITPRSVVQRCYSNQALACGTNCKYRKGQCSPLDEGVVRDLFPEIPSASTPNISTSTQTSAYQLATRIADYHTNLIRGGTGRKRNVYGDVKKAPAPPPSSRSGKRTSNARDDEQ
jgi:hypothetical protein